MPKPEFMVYRSPRHAALLRGRAWYVTKRRIIRNPNPRLAMTR